VQLENSTFSGMNMECHSCEKSLYILG